MVLYHGSTKDRVQELLEKQKYNPKFDKDGWNGIWATTSVDHARHYGDYIVKIVVDDAYSSKLIGYPIFAEAMETVEDWMHGAVEYIIPAEVPFIVEEIRGKGEILWKLRCALLKLSQ